MWMESIPTFHSKGLFVHILQPEIVPKTDPWTNPVMVRIADAGPDAIPKLYVDSKLVGWNDLDGVLKEELERRPPIDWIVYLEVDPNMEYEKAVLVIDVIRKDQAQVVILTPKSAIPRHSNEVVYSTPLAGMGRPISFMTICRSFQVSFFWRGSRRRKAG
jgi:hypothetical protein